MRVRIRLFGRLHDLAGTSVLERDAPEDATVGRVWEMLAAEFPPLAPYSRSISAAVDAEFAKMGARVADGSEVAFLPPVSGG